jgi:hypothetical protein
MLQCVAKSTVRQVFGMVINLNSVTGYGVQNVGVIWMYSSFATWLKHRFWESRRILIVPVINIFHETYETKSLNDRFL